MELTDAVLGDVPMIVAAGAVNHSTCGELQTALHRWLEARYNIVFLDLTDVTDMDEAGVSVLVDWVQALHGRGWLGVIGATDPVRSSLESAELLVHPNVRVFETRQAARVVTAERQST